EVDLVAGEGLDEVLARHAGAIDAQAQDLTLVRAHLVDQMTYRVAQALDGLGGKADAQQDVGNLLLQRLIFLGLALAGREDFLLALMQRADFREAFERIGLELQEIGGVGAGLLLGGGFLVVLVVAGVVVRVIVIVVGVVIVGSGVLFLFRRGGFVLAGIGVYQAVDEF